MPAKWVDMKALREQVSMEDVLAHYELLDTLKRKGKSLVGRCPIHKGTSPSQFSVSLEKNLFNCFEGKFCRSRPARFTLLDRQNLPPNNTQEKNTQRKKTQLLTII